MNTIFSNVGLLLFISLNIGLPTVDVTTDMWMIIKLFKGAYGCVNPRWWSEDYKAWENCSLRVGADDFCTDPDTFHQDMCREKEDSNFLPLPWDCVHPKNWSQDYRDWDSCREGAHAFCKDKDVSSEICQYETHPKYGISMMIPYLLNYLICILTWQRLDLKKNRTFLFPLINGYTQLGTDLK